MTALLPADVRRVVGRWSPDSLVRWDRGFTVADSIAIVAPPGLSNARLRAAVADAGWSVAEIDDASAVVVVLDPDMPVGRAQVASVHRVPSEVPLVVLASNEHAVDDLVSYVPRCRTETWATDEDAAVAEVIRRVDESDRTRTEHLALTGVIGRARTALAAAAEADIGTAEITALREQRRRAVTPATGPTRRSLAEVRVDLAHRVGVHRRETLA
ncbi:MAG: hypothetical protein WA931_05125, partial [Rhodococcus sp. (in: high G+C Gram-positive bacteria)]